MKILLVESDASWGVTIYQLLCQEKYIVDWVRDELTAWNYLDSECYQYTLAIISFGEKNLTGLKLCQRLRETQNSLPLMMLTTQERWDDGILSLDAGADDYLAKPFRTEELLARLRALRRRAPQFQPLTLRFGSLSLDCDSQTLSWQPNLHDQYSVQLSKKEFQLLEYFMRHPHKAMNHDHILNYLYEVEVDRTSNVVAAQIRRLRRRFAKLGCEGVIQTLPGGSYRLNPAYLEVSVQKWHKSSNS